MTNNNEEEVIKAMIQQSVDEGFAVASNYSKDAFQKFNTKYWKPGFSIIRPSGNPMSREVWEGMISSDDVEMVSSELLKVNNVQILACGSAAFAVYTHMTNSNTRVHPMIILQHSLLYLKRIPQRDLGFMFMHTVEPDRSRQ